MDSFRLLAVLSLLLYCQAYTPCIAFICDPSGLDWPEGVCGQPVPTNSTAYAVNSKVCSIHEYCDMSLTPATCQTVYNHTTDVLPGEPCNALHSCEDGVNCVNGTCEFLSLGSTCKNVQDCGLGATCRGNICVTLMQDGDLCTNDTDCSLSMGCDIGAHDNLGRCVQYLSQPENQTVASCAAKSGSLAYNPFCASSYCYLSDTASYPRCTALVTSNETPPSRCSVPSNSCSSSPDPVSHFIVSIPCECGFDGYSYCSLFPGDKPMQEYFTFVKKFLNSAEVNLCNTARHSEAFYTYLGNPCVNATSKATAEMKYRYLFAVHYGQVVLADSCIVKVLFPGLDTSTSEKLLYAGFAALVVGF